MIGAGGMGEVYKCHEIQTGTAVAIKMLLPEMAENEAALALFRREASALHHLLHEAIVRYFVFTVEPALQRPYLAMEFVDGRSLSDILEEGPLTFEALLKLMRRIASGLQAAHERGIIHRDVSPDNIIVPLGDVTRAKIIDFGIARSTQLGDKTIIGAGFAGKDNYVSPEQVGLYGNEVTAKSDIYSLGLLLFYALTGQKLDMGGSQFPAGREAPARARSRRGRHADPSAARADAAAGSGEPAGNDGGDRELAGRIVTIARLRSAGTRRGACAPAGTGHRAEAKSPRALAGRCCFCGGGTGRSGRLRVLQHGLVGAGCIQAAATAGVRPEIRRRPGRSRKHRRRRCSRRRRQSRPPASDAAARADRVRRYVEQYNGGDCFFILPVALSSNAAVIEGFGASTAPFEALDKAFKRDLGFEASIGVRQVTQAQCPAIKFLSQLGSNQARAPRINLASVEVKNGETLSGTIENFANRVVELLLVSDSGEVRNLSYLLKPGTDSLSFSIGIQRNGSGNGPQLVMAVATPQVLNSLRQPKPMAADTFFLQAVSEAQRNNVTISTAARYFRLTAENQ